MAKLKHNDPCHCGSGKRYRSCHLRADREAAAREPATAPAAGQPEPSPIGQSSWMRMAPWVIGVVGVAAAAWVGTTFDTARGGGVLLLTGITIAAIYIFGDPPPPKEGTSDPAAINFGR
ncbi:MAG: SEC-C domain-containing protein [Myxococcales bacterium]|nr:SEC-C domain-containing protein [Myxococcales bacterium]